MTSGATSSSNSRITRCTSTWVLPEPAFAETKAEAQRLTDNLMSLARRYYAGRAGIGSTDAGSASPETAADANLFGTPEEVVESIHFLRENFSSDEIMFEVNWTASVPRDVVMNTMRLITDKVIPQFK